jgi:hypothetical protein
LNHRRNANLSDQEFFGEMPTMESGLRANFRVGSMSYRNRKHLYQASAAHERTDELAFDL